MELRKTLELNMLFDFYGKLLTEKQREYMTYYYREDYSLGEISVELGVSRQAVFDNIKRSETTLRHYEDILGLYQQFNKQHSQLDALKTHALEYYTHDLELHTLINRLIND